MARILYGVSGDGMGHATRSRVIIDYLLKKHEVVIVCGDKAYDYLSKYYADVHKIFALRIIYGNNEVRNFHTAVYNISKYPTEGKESLEKIRKILREFKPEIIITDFEYFTDIISKKYGIPSISIDNNHILNKCEIEIPKKELDSYITARLVVNSIVKNARYYIITTFFYPDKSEKNVLLFPPILRKKFFELKSETNEHILVYQTTDTHDDLIPVLKKIKQKFIVYGLNKSDEEENITFREFNEHQFYEDLRKCKAVITNGGFSLISEALSLHKPIFSVPIKKQFEQICNAVYIAKLGYGVYHKKISVTNVEEFIKKLDHYRENLRKYRKKDNSKLFQKLDEIIEEMTRSSD